MANQIGTDWSAVLQNVRSDQRYSEGIAYGKPRSGHAEGTVAVHIAQLEGNLEKLRAAKLGNFGDSPSLLRPGEYEKLMVLIHVHDTFKLWAKRDSPILDSRSHASLAKAFLEELIGSEDTECADMLRIVQFHDEGYALWKQVEARGSYNRTRFEYNVLSIVDIELFLLFTLIDGFTPSKDPERIRWFVNEVAKLRSVDRMYLALTLFGI